MRFGTATLVVALVTVTAASADVVELKTGQRIEGGLKQATPTSVVVEVGGHRGSKLSPP